MSEKEEAEEDLVESEVRGEASASGISLNQDDIVEDEGRQRAAAKVLSSFVFATPDWWGRQTEEGQTTSSATQVDDDGDWEVPRKKAATMVTLVIEHKTRTKLDDVGAQVWRGALFLNDYLLDNPQEVKGAKVLEIGAGTGLTAIVAAAAGGQITATDLPHCLPLLKSNLRRNALTAPCVNGIRVAALDVTRPLSPANVGGEEYVQVLLGADVVYDDDVSRGVASLVRSLADRSPLTCLFSVDKRYNFTLEEMDVRASAYEHFLAALAAELAGIKRDIRSEEDFSEALKISQTFTAKAEVISLTEVRQRFAYEPSPHLILLKLTVSPKEKVNLRGEK